MHILQISYPYPVLLLTESPREPYLSIDGRRLDAGNLFIPVKENQALTIECIVEGGNPRPSLHWVLEPSEHNMDTAPNLVFSEPVTPKTGKYPHTDTPGRFLDTGRRFKPELGDHILADPFFSWHWTSILYFPCL